MAIKEEDLEMNLHTLTNSNGAKHRRKRVGRGNGSGFGETCGKGQKGQLSRAGHNRKPGFEGGQMRFVRRIPKRGFTNPTEIIYVPVNVGALACFDDGATVDCELLATSGLANAGADGVKILGTGELDKKLTVRANAFSTSARAKIEAAGGTCELIVFEKPEADAAEADAGTEK